MTDPPPVASPCIGLCAIGDDGLCDGCRRSLDEIAAWPTLAEAERERIIADLPERRRGDG